ncbi:MAG: metal-dependent hydrolase [Bacteroidota bacterium]
MDSLTQIVLGAAVGEAMLGRKLDNRAMLWGGIAGTLPDLDVLANMATDPISALVYHRSFTHSIAFAALAAPIMGWATYLLYKRSSSEPEGESPRTLPGPRVEKRLRPSSLASDAGRFSLLVIAFYLLLWLGSELVPLDIFRLPQVAAYITAALVGLYFIVYMRERWRKKPSRAESVSPAAWTGLFFAAIVTHPLLDCCTMYGTQLLQPFDNIRVAWNTVSVADVFYTLPFSMFLLLAARRAKATKGRTRLNRLGLIISSAYLLLTAAHYFWVDHILHHSLEDQGIAHQRTIHGPTLLTNFLWQATAETEDQNYWISDYSFFDARRKFQPFKQVEGRQELLADIEDTRTVRLLRYFTNDYLGVIPLPDGRLQLNDLRYGYWGDDPNDPRSYLFHWVVDPNKFPLEVTQETGPPEGGAGEVFEALWERTKGI